MSEDLERAGGRRPALLRSRTVRLGLLLAAAGAAAFVYARTRAAEGATVERLGTWGLRLGLSLVAGYAVGQLFRRARAKALALLAALAVAAVALKWLGVLDDPALQERMKQLTASAVEGASKVKGWVYGLLPDGAAAAVGGFLGLRGGAEQDADA